MDEIPPQVPGYRLTRLLGVGSTAHVWRARRVEDDELVAIKLLPGEPDDQALREYSLLQHAAAEHVVALHETLVVDTDAGPATALVLEHLAGGSLARVVAERGHLSPGETVTVIAPIAQALAGLHDQGIVHGDLSPGNVLLDSTGRPVIADLGCSRLTGEAPGEVYGTDGHIAPEVLEGSEPSRASDVHSLGALAWLCLVGATPEHIAVRSDLADLLPGEPALAAVVESCLATDPQARPEADEVARKVFDAVAAEPLRMTVTGDITTSLTRRIREAAQEGVPTPEWQIALTQPPPDQERRWWQRRTTGAKGEPHLRLRGEEVDHGGEHARRRARRPGRHAAPRRRRDEPIDLTIDHVEPTSGHEARAGGSEPRAIARAALGVTAQGALTWPRRRVASTAAVALALALVVLVPWRQLASAGEGPGPTATTRVASGGAGAASSTAPAGNESADSVRHDRSAPRLEPTALVRELTALREELVTGLDPQVLAGLDVPGSPAAERDRELVADLRESGQRYRGITMTVRSGVLQSTGGTRAVVRAVVDESAYEVVASDGVRTPRPARRGQQVDIVLAWHEGAWRVRDVWAVS